MNSNSLSEEIRGGISERDLMPGYLDSEEASVYLRSPKRKLGLLIKHGLLRYAKLGKGYIFRKEWLDDFMENWSGYDLGTEEKIIFAKSSRSWEERHG